MLELVPLFIPGEQLQAALCEEYGIDWATPAQFRNYIDRQMETKFSDLKLFTAETTFEQLQCELGIQPFNLEKLITESEHGTAAERLRNAFLGKLGSERTWAYLRQLDQSERLHKIDPGSSDALRLLMQPACLKHGRIIPPGFCSEVRRSSINYLFDDLMTDVLRQMGRMGLVAYNENEFVLEVPQECDESAMTEKIIERASRVFPDWETPCEISWPERW
jgi:hypothetical protein